jgi:hypothetical protein
MRLLYGTLLGLTLAISAPALAQSPGVQIPNGMQQFVDANGAPYAGGLVYFYVPGTTTPKITYLDPTLATPNVNPIRLDAAGRAIIWGATGELYRQVLTSSNNVTIWDQVVEAGSGVPIPLPIAKGGTARTTLTQNSVLIGEGLGQINFAVPSTPGQPLVSTGPTSDPVFGKIDPHVGITLPGGESKFLNADGDFVPVGSVTNLAGFTGPGTYTFTIPSDTIQVFLKGAGGGGGGGSTTLNGSGGGEGASAVSIYSGLTVGNTLIVTVGSAGSGGFTGVNGTNGGTSRIDSGTQTIASSIAGGGSGGFGAAALDPIPGGGGGGAIGGNALQARGNDGHFGGSKGLGLGAYSSTLGGLGSGGDGSPASATPGAGIGGGSGLVQITW